LRGFDDDVDVFSQMISPVHEFSSFARLIKSSITCVAVHKTFHCDKDKLTPYLVGIRKHFVPNGEWTLYPTKIGVTLSLYEWKELKKTIPLFEDREPQLRTMDNKVTGED
jgi:hypothetical protein